METLVDGNQEINLFPETEEEEVVRNVGIIIASPKFSVVLNRGFGTRHREVDSPVNIAKPRIVMDVINEIEKYEPRAEVTKVELRGDTAQEGKLAPVVGVRIKL